LHISNVVAINQAMKYNSIGMILQCFLLDIYSHCGLLKGQGSHTSIRTICRTHFKDIKKRTLNIINVIVYARIGEYINWIHVLSKIMHHCLVSMQLMRLKHDANIVWERIFSFTYSMLLKMNMFQLTFFYGKNYFVTKNKLNETSKKDFWRK